MEITLFIINAYYDLNDYESPIHTFVEAGLLFGGINGLAKEVKFYFQNNYVEAQDDYLSIISQPTKHSYISLAAVYDSLLTSDEEIIKFSFYKSNHETTIERSVFTLLDLLGNLGGIFEVLSVSGSIIVAIFSNKMFYFSIFSSLYQVDMMKCQIDHQTNSKHKDRSPTDVNLTIHKSEECKSIDLVRNSMQESHKEDSYCEPTLESRTDFKQNIFDKVKANIENRRLYNYKTADVCYNILRCCKFKF